MLRLEADDASHQSKLQETENDQLKKLVADLKQTSEGVTAGV